MQQVAKNRKNAKTQKFAINTQTHSDIRKNTQKSQKYSQNTHKIIRTNTQNNAEYAQIHTVEIRKYTQKYAKIHTDT